MTKREATRKPIDAGGKPAIVQPDLDVLRARKARGRPLHPDHEKLLAKPKKGGKGVSDG